MADVRDSNPSALFPANNLRAVTPNDGADLPTVSVVGNPGAPRSCRGLWVSSAGVVNVLAYGDTSPVALTVTAGTLIPVFAKRVYATSTTATGIVALY
jgi:hypothetical protein